MDRTGALALDHPRRLTVRSPAAVIDRLPPQSIEAEQSVLGSILIDRDAVIEVAEFLKAGGLLPPGARQGLRASSWTCSSGASPSTSSRSRRRWSADGDLEAIGGRAYLGTLSNATPTAVHATQYARIVERKALLRNLIGAAGKIAGIGYEDPAEVAEAIDRAEAELFAVSQRRVAAGFSPLKTLLHDAYDRLDYLHAHRGEISGIRTGFQDLDTLTTGLQKSDLVILAARPSVGKTSFALNIAEHAAVQDRKTRRHLQPRDEQGAARAAPALGRSPTSTPSACGRASSRSWTSRGSPRR